MHSLLKEACSVLGVAEDADADAIAAAFKALAMKWHPDRNKDNVEEATARFAELSAARDLLLDPPPQLLLPDAPTAAAAQAAAEDAQRAALRAYDKSTDVTDALRSGSVQLPYDRGQAKHHLAKRDLGELHNGTAEVAMDVY